MNNTVEIREWGELALMESLLDDWLMQHSKSHHFYADARNLLRRVRKSLINSDITEEQI